MYRKMKLGLGKTSRFLAVFAALAILLAAVSASAGSPFKPTGKLSFRLDALANAPEEASARRLSLPESGALSLMRSDQGGVLVYIRLAEISESALQALADSGARITHTDETYRTVTAFVQPTDLVGLAALDAVENITEALKPVRRQADCPTAITSEGDVQLKADQARQQYNVDGTGVTVGVLSDSYAGVTSPTSAPHDIAHGDLPGANNPCGRTTPVNVLEDYIDPDSTDEGRAMLQIVHDLAPGAELAFATAFSGLFGFADNIKRLRNDAGADIIVDDVGYFDEPFFQDGPVSTAITEVTADGAVYFTSAGNSNLLDGSGNNVSSYEASQFRGTTCPTVTYQGAPQTLGDACHNFDPNGDTAYQELVLVNNGSIIPILQWAEAWYGLETDLDLILTDASFNVLAFSVNTNTGTNGTQRPVEVLGYQNQTGADQTVRLIVARHEGSTNPRLKYLFIRGAGVQSTLFNASNSSDVFGPSIFGHAGGAEAMSIAAVPYDDSDNPEPFTSHGKLTVYFEPVSGTTPAAPLAAPATRDKPDVAATDGGANTFFGSYSSGAYRFYGTSAAAPHAAAVAALMRDYYNDDPASYSWSWGFVEQYMETSAAVVAGGGETITGAGLVDAPAAINAMIQGPVCNYSLDPTSANVNAAGGTASFTVVTNAGCNWTAVSNNSWVTIAGGSTGVGQSDVTYTVSSNSGGARTGTITVAGQTFTINQAAAGSGGGGGGGGGGCYLNSILGR